MRKDLEAEGQAGVAGREREVRHVEREIGHLDRRLVRARDRDPPDLAGAGAGREVVEALAVGRPARAGVAGRVGGELEEPLAVDPHHPDVVAAPVGLEVGGPHHEGHPAAIGRGLRIADPLHRIQVAGGERMRLRGPDRGGGEAEEAGKSEERLAHGFPFSSPERLPRAVREL